MFYSYESQVNIISPFIKLCFIETTLSIADDLSEIVYLKVKCKYEGIFLHILCFAYMHSVKRMQRGFVDGKTQKKVKGINVIGNIYDFNNKHNMNVQIKYKALTP